MSYADPLSIKNSSAKTLLFGGWGGDRWWDGEWLNSNSMSCEVLPVNRKLSSVYITDKESCKQ